MDILELLKIRRLPGWGHEWVPPDLGEIHFFQNKNSFQNIKS
jgi:hypothetical protein